MRTPYYREQALEGIAREVITAYDPNLYYGVPRMIPIEDIIEAQGITLEYQCLRKTGCVLGETIFDDGGAIIYDYDIPGYTVIAVKGGTILIDSSLCREDASTGRLRFTCAHELAHWLLHKRLYSGTGESAAMMTGTNIVRTQNSALEMQANLLGSILLMPLPQVKRCFYQLQPGRDRQQLVADMADIFQVSKQAMRIRLENHHLLRKNFRKLFSKKRTEKARRHGTRNTQDPSLSHLREGTDRGCSCRSGSLPISAVCHGRK